MKPGTIIRLPDGREGTVVYHGLDGYGIQFGRKEIDMSFYLNTNPLFGEKPENWPYTPQAMLRSPDVKSSFPGLECVGEEYIQLEEGNEEFSLPDSITKYAQGVRREGRTVVLISEETDHAIELFKVLERIIG